MGDFLEKIGKNCFQAGKIWIFDSDNGGGFVFELLWGVIFDQNGKNEDKI